MNIYDAVAVKCRTCGGVGSYGSFPCRICNGSGERLVRLVGYEPKPRKGERRSK